MATDNDHHKVLVMEDHSLEVPESILLQGSVLACSLVCLRVVVSVGNLPCPFTRH